MVVGRVILLIAIASCWRICGALALLESIRIIPSGVVSISCDIVGHERRSLFLVLNNNTVYAIDALIIEGTKRC